jgi:DNA replication protein DnaC
MTETTTHGPAEDGACRCGWAPPAELSAPAEDPADEAQRLELLVDLRAAHYEAVGHVPTDLGELGDLAFGPVPDRGTERRFADQLEAAMARLRPKQPPIPEPPPPDPAAVARQADAAAQVRSATWSTLMPSRFTWAQPDHFGPAIASELRAWGEAPGGRNLVLVGATGVGKTHAAIAAMRVAYDHGAHVLFLPVVELLDQLRPGGGDGATMDELCGVDVLGLDDVGAERPSDWTAERLYAVVNRRWMEERPMVATSNLEPQALQQALGERTYSRLVGGAVVLQLGGADRRRA